MGDNTLSLIAELPAMSVVVHAFLASLLLEGHQEGRPSSVMHVIVSKPFKGNQRSRRKSDKWPSEIIARVIVCASYDSLKCNCHIFHSFVIFLCEYSVPVTDIIYNIIGLPVENRFILYYSTCLDTEGDV